MLRKMRAETCEESMRGLPAEEKTCVVWGMPQSWATVWLGEKKRREGRAENHRMERARGRDRKYSTRK